jgi:hypothetical protein
MAALSTAEEPHFALISRPELTEPPERKIVLALGALDLHRRLRFYFIVLIVHNGYLILRALFLPCHMFGGFNLPDIPTLAAFKLATR